MKAKYFLLWFAPLVVAISLLSGCNTVRGTAAGFGQDVHATTHAVSNTF